MIGAVKNWLLAIAALFLSAGHAACAGLSVADDLAPVVEMAAGDNTSAHHHAGHGVDEAQGRLAPAPLSDDCGHCASASMDGVAVKAVAGPLPSQQKFMALAPAPAAFLTIILERSGAMASRLHWAAPPRSSPVRLKTRLRN